MIEIESTCSAPPMPSKTCVSTGLPSVGSLFVRAHESAVVSSASPLDVWRIRTVVCEPMSDWTPTVTVIGAPVGFSRMSWMRMYPSVSPCAAAGT